MLVDAFLAEFLGQSVGADDEEQADDGLEQADGGAEAELALPDAETVYVGIKDVRDIGDGAVHHQKHLLEADVHHMADPQNEQNDDDGTDGRQRHVPDLPKSARSVHLSCFVQLRINSRDGGKENDRAPSCVLPDGLQRQQSPEIVLVRKKIDLIKAEGDKQLVHDAVAGGQKQKRDADDDDPGQEMR